MTLPLQPIAAAAALSALLGACAAPASVNAWRAARDYTLPMAGMGAVPCVSDEAARRFRSAPSRSSHTSTGQYDLNRRGGLGAPEELEVRPSDAASGEERVLIGFWTSSPDSTRVRVAVVAQPSRRSQLEKIAAEALEQCGAWPR